MRQSNKYDPRNAFLLTCHRQSSIFAARWKVSPIQMFDFSRMAAADLWVIAFHKNNIKRACYYIFGFYCCWWFGKSEIHSLVWSFPQCELSDEKQSKFVLTYKKFKISFLFCVEVLLLLFRVKTGRRKRKKKKHQKSAQFSFIQHIQHCARSLTHLLWPKNCNCPKN